MAEYSIQEEGKKDTKLDEIMRKLNEEYVTRQSIERREGSPTCTR